MWIEFVLFKQNSENIQNKVAIYLKKKQFLKFISNVERM